MSRKTQGARKYLELPFVCDFTSYGNNIVASVSPPLVQIAQAYIDRFPTEHCFETPNLHVLMQALAPMGLNVCFMAEYFLPDVDRLRPMPCAYQTKILCQNDFGPLYLPQWSNALCEKRKNLDVLAVAAYDNDRLIGLAGCSADCDTMWQIGVDVLPEYRRQGVASALTSRLALEILDKDRVPFYCAAWSNLKSVGNALKCGFKPAWVQMTVKPNEVIQQYNQ